MYMALKDASLQDHLEIARVLLNSGAPVNLQPDTSSPLGLASLNGHLEMVLLLIEHGANIEEINEDGYTPLMEAVQEGHTDVVSVLLLNGNK